VHDVRPAVTRHPDAATVHAAVQLAAPAVLLHEGAERGEEAEGDAGDEGSSVHHSMTRSARSSSDWGIVRPRALAVFRLISRLNVGDCSTGRSAGLAPFKMRSTK